MAIGKPRVAIPGLQTLAAPALHSFRITGPIPNSFDIYKLGYAMVVRSCLAVLAGGSYNPAPISVDMLRAHRVARLGRPTVRDADTNRHR